MSIKRTISLLVSNIVIHAIIPFKRRCYITCAGKSDGMGAQAQAVYSALLYCHVNNLSYCHSPLNEIAHNYDDNKFFNEDIEHFFSFSKDEKLVSDLPGYTLINLDNITFQSISRIIGYIFSSQPKVIFQKSHYHNYVNKISPKYVLIKKKLQDKFYNNPKQDTITDKKSLRIACHIRRGDVNEDDTMRYTGNEAIYQKLNSLRSILEKMHIPCRIDIYSMGKKEDFGNLGEIASLHLNGNVFEDFYSLVKADILFMAKSSYSYSAALLSDGVIVYEPFWHPPLNEWFIITGDHFNENFMQAVQSAYTKKVKNI